MKIKEMLADSRSREKLAKRGVEALSDDELLAVILQQGTCGENVIDMRFPFLKISSCIILYS